MNNGWFYILLANIAALGAHIWLFSDKSQPVDKIVVEKIIEVPVFKTGLLKDFGISSVESFHFPLMDPRPSKEELLQLQLDSTQATVNKKNSAIKKEQQKRAQQSQQLARLKSKNDQLHQQLLLLDVELENHETLIANQKQKIAHLEKIETVTPTFETEIERVKNSIDSMPDLIKSKTVKVDATKSVADKQALSSEFDQGKFSGSMEFGFSYEKDNQETKAIQGRFILDYDKVDKYNINSDVEFEFENEDKEMTTEKYRWQLQSDYNLNPANLVYARSDINRSQFSSYEREDIFTVGYGRIFFNTEKHKFNIELGPGYRFAEPNVGKDAVSVDEFIVRTRLNYERVLTDSLQFAMDTVLEAGHENSVHSLSFKAQNRIYQELYLVFNFDYKYTQNVPVDTVNEEISSGLSLLYAF